MAQEYIIVGDTDKFTGCLVRICLGADKTQAETILERVRNEAESVRYKNLRIEEIGEKDAWWNDSVLVD